MSAGQLFTLPSDSVVLTADDCYTPKWVFDAMGIEFAITAALTPTPAVPSGAGEAGGAVDEHGDADAVLGAQAGVQHG